MKYIVLPGETDIQKGWDISAAAFAFSRPPAVRSAGDVTTHYTSPIQHPTTGAVALPLPEDDVITAHPQSSKDGLLSLLSPYLTQAEIDGLTTLMPSLNGTDVNLLSVIEDSLPTLAAQIKTRDELDANGFFPKTELI